MNEDQQMLDMLHKKQLQLKSDKIIIENKLTSIQNAIVALGGCITNELPLNNPQFITDESLYNKNLTWRKKAVHILLDIGQGTINQIISEIKNLEPDVNLLIAEREIRKQVKRMVKSSIMEVDKSGVSYVYRINHKAEAKSASLKSTMSYIRRIRGYFENKKENQPQSVKPKEMPQVEMAINTEKTPVRAKWGCDTNKNYVPDIYNPKMRWNIKTLFVLNKIKKGTTGEVSKFIMGLEPDQRKFKIVERVRQVMYKMELHGIVLSDKSVRPHIFEENKQNTQDLTAKKTDIDAHDNIV